MESAGYTKLFPTAVLTFADLISSEFAKSSCYDLLSFFNWDPEKTLSFQSSPIRYCRGRLYAMNLDIVLESTKDIEKTDVLAPLVLTRNIDSLSGRKTLSSVTSLFILDYLHEGSVNRSLIPYIDERMRNSISQSILSIRKSKRSGHFKLVSDDQKNRYCY